MSMINEEASASSSRVKSLSQEKAELESNKEELDQRIDTLSILLAAEKSKLEKLESHLPKVAEMSEQRV